MLVSRELPYVGTHKPTATYPPDSLTKEFEQYLSKNPRFFDELANSPKANLALPIRTDQGDFATAREDPPQILAILREQEAAMPRRGRKTDWLQRDARVRQLGKEGERWVVEGERQRLAPAGREDLAQKVVWVSKEEDFGDGLGFDVLSFCEQDDSEMQIEVKTTTHGKDFAFTVTINEVLCSEENPNSYYLYRVFDFLRLPRYYVLPGSLKSSCFLEPTQFRASPIAGPGLL